MAGSPGQALPAKVLSLFDESSMVVLRKADGGQILIIGSAHAGCNAAKTLVSIMAAWRPDVVAVELCPARLAAMTGVTQAEGGLLLPAAGTGAGGLPSLAAVSMMLSSLPLALVAGAVAGDEYGGDMVSAAAFALQRGLPLYLADRSQAVTLSRIAFGLEDVLPGWHTAQLVGGLAAGSDALLAAGVRGYFASEIRQCTPHVPAPLRRDMHTMGQCLADIIQSDSATPEQVAAMAAAVPGVLAASMEDFRHRGDASGYGAAMVGERDEWMAHTLAAAPGRRAVAVVGVGHLEGIQAHWGKVSPARMQELAAPPADFYLWNAVLPLATLGGVAYGLRKLHAARPAVAWGVGGGVAAGVLAVGMAATALKARTERVCEVIAAARESAQ